MLTRIETQASQGVPVEVKEVSISLFGPYLIGVELASILLLAGLIGAYHLGRQYGQQQGTVDGGERDRA